MIKVSRWLGIGVFAIAVAVMPLGNLFSGGSFETWLGGVESRPRVRVMLQDDTGLVRAVMGDPETETSRENSRTVLSVPVSGGCGTRVIHLAFRNTGGEYVIHQRNDEFACSFLNLVDFGRVSVFLWAPADAPVRLDSPYGGGVL